MGFLVKFKVSEILCVTMFNTICTSSFDTKFIHRTMETTQSMVMDSCVLHFTTTHGDGLHLNTTHGGFLRNCRNYIG
jgi:hypothetical protein